MNLIRRSKRARKSMGTKKDENELVSSAVSETLAQIDMMLIAGMEAHKYASEKMRRHGFYWEGWTAAFTGIKPFLRTDAFRLLRGGLLDESTKEIRRLQEELKCAKTRIGELEKPAQVSA